MRKKANGSFQKKLLISIAVFLLVFTAICLAVTAATGVEPAALEGTVFAFCGAECGFNALIKSAKVKATKENEKASASETPNETEELK